MIGDIIIPGLSHTVALAVVAMLGYFVGWHSKQVILSKEQARRDLEQAASNTKQLETIVDGMLEATRHALHECQEIGPRQALIHSGYLQQSPAASASAD